MIENISALLRLNDGMEMPGFGFGCYKASGPELALAVRLGLNVRDIAETQHAFLSWSEVVRVAASKLLK